MASFNISLKPSGVDPDARARAIYAVYKEILSWSDPRIKKTEPAAVDLGGDAGAGSENGSLAITSGSEARAPI